jgi:colanic acid/amylovoran biosynthesis glycosyltransferase
VRIGYILEHMSAGWLSYELDAVSDLRARISIHPVNPATYGSFGDRAGYKKRTMAGDLVRAGAVSCARPFTSLTIFRRLSSYAGKKIALAALSTARIIGRERPDIIHAHFATAPAAAAWAVSRLTGIPYGFTAHGGYDLTKEPIDRGFLAVTCRDAAFVRCVSGYGRRRLISMTGIDDARITVIHCGVDTRYFAPRASGESEMRKTRTILTVAGLVEPKGIVYLFRALAEPPLRGSEIRPVIVGGGPLREDLEREAGRLGIPAVFAGPVGNDEVKRYYHDADLFVLPCVTGQDGHHDGIPVVLMEAMACGVPVISTRLSGIPELVEDGKSGLLVPEKDPRALSGAIAGLLADADMRRRFSDEGRKKVVAEFDIRDVARRLMELFRISGIAGDNGGHTR